MNKNNFYTTKYVLDKVGITRLTLYKWLKNGRIPEVARDRNNNRLFSMKNIDKILEYKNLIKKPTSSSNQIYNRIKRLKRSV